MTAPADSPDMDEIREIFKTYDRDGNGVIDREEFAALVRAIDPDFTDEEIATGLDTVDENGDGNIQWSEFYAWWIDR